MKGFSMKLYDGGILMILAIAMVSGTSLAVTGGAIMDHQKEQELREQSRVVYVDYEQASYAETPECIEYNGRLYCD